MDIKIFFGAISVIISLICYPQYVYSIFRGQTKPHAFSWGLWALTELTVSIAQVWSGAGPGSWAAFSTGLLCAVIFFIALFRGERSRTTLDWICLWSALAAILLWIVTDNPLYSVFLITVIDGLAFVPTFRKSWRKPFEENALLFFLSAVKYVFTLLAIEAYNLTTLVFPVYLVIANTAFVTMVMWRRQRKI